mgnify:CR=1 FL=1
MTGTMRWRRALVGLTLAGVMSLSHAADTTGSKTADNTSEFTLSNGLRLIVREDHRLRARPDAELVKYIRYMIPHGLFAD